MEHKKYSEEVVTDRKGDNQEVISESKGVLLVNFMIWTHFGSNFVTN